MKKSLHLLKIKTKIAFSRYFRPVFLLGTISLFSFPHLTSSQTLLQASKAKNIGPIAAVVIKPYQMEPSLPSIPKRDPRRTMFITVTAYSSEPEQTDSTPFITAFGTQVRDGIVATNFLPKGTVVRFPEVFGDKEFVVEDRMNARYYYRMDIWMADTQDAIQFGAKYLKVEIL